MRIAILGSSHVGAIKDALPQNKAAFPGIRFNFFATPGGSFRRCVLRGGVWRAKPESDAQAALIAQINGALTVEVGTADQIWTTGFRFGYGAALDAYLNDADPAPSVAKVVHDSLSRITDQFRAARNLTLTPAPYPALRSRAPGPKQEFRMTKIQRDPDRDAHFEAYEAEITQQVGQTPYRLMLQPRATLGAPFATANRYLNAARDFASGQDMEGDLRHMNATYGYDLFHAYATQMLGLTPET